MTIEIPVTQEAVIKMKIYDVVQFDKQKDEDKKVGLVVDFYNLPDDKQKDEDKKVGLVVDFYNLPDDMEVIMDLNIADEDLNIVNE